MAPSVKVVKFKLNVARVRSWFNRLPFFTRITLFIVLLFWIAELVLPWIPAWGALTPDQIDFSQLHRLNTYPLIHAGFLHTFLSLAALIPLLASFESANGTLVATLLFLGPFSTIPAAIYIFVQKFVLRSSVSVEGSNVWIFSLLACEAVKTHRANPSFRLGQYNVPVWPYPLVLLLLIHYILPRPLLLADSLVLNIAGACIGYLFELSYLRLLVPPERILRFLETRLNLLGRLPHYVSVDQKTFGRYGAVLPTHTVDVNVPVPGLAELGIGRRSTLSSSPRMNSGQVLGDGRFVDARPTA